MAISKEEIDCLLKKQRQSVLHKCKDDVLKLRKEGVTLTIIKEWLENEHEIETSCENIRQFCLRYDNDIVTIKVDTTMNKSENKKLFENLEKEEL